MWVLIASIALVISAREDHHIDDKMQGASASVLVSTSGVSGGGKVS
ncbi:hypothetical protein ACLQ3C_14130 [Gordonia sp. DT30]